MKDQYATVLFVMALGLYGCGAGGGQESTVTAGNGPAVPSALTATPVRSTEIDLNWAPATGVGVTGYQLDRCQEAGCTSFMLIASPTASSYNDTGLVAGTVYSYRVRAMDADGHLSDHSSIAVATTPIAQLVTLAFDDFNRPDSIDLGPDWDAGYAGHQNAQIVSNAIKNTSTSPAAPKAIESYNAIATPNDQSCEITFRVFQGTSDTEEGCTLRMADPPTIGWYVFQARRNGPYTSSIGTHHPGGVGDAELASEASILWGPGDKLRGEAIGTTLKLYRTPAGGNETLLLTAGNSEFSGGRAGILMWMQVGGNLADVEIDNFSVYGF